MHDLLFKNITSQDRRKRIIVSSEIKEEEGIRTAVQRHLVCIVKEVNLQQDCKNAAAAIFITRERDTSLKYEKFMLKMKGSLYVSVGDKLYLIIYLHLLNISISHVGQGVTGDIFK